jgi:hypothetical protein
LNYAAKCFADESRVLSKILNDDPRLAWRAGVVAWVGEARETLEKNFEFEELLHFALDRQSSEPCLAGLRLLATKSPGVAEEVVIAATFVDWAFRLRNDHRAMLARGDGARTGLERAPNSASQRDDALVYGTNPPHARARVDSRRRGAKRALPLAANAPCNIALRHATQKSARAGRYLDRLGAYDSPTWRGVAGMKPQKETLLQKERGGENYEPCEDSGSFGRSGNAHGLRSRVWRWKRRATRSNGSLRGGRQEFVQRQRRRRRSRGERQIVLQRQRRCRQVVVQRVGRTRGSEVLT